MIEEIKKDSSTRMSKSLEALKHEFSKLRTGRAQASLLDHVSVSYYGSDTPLNQVASVVVSDARTLTVTPWEKKIVPDVEKAILNADLGLNPVTAVVETIRFCIVLICTHDLSCKQQYCN